MLLKFHRSFQMKITTFCIILLFTCSNNYGQNLIGYKNDEIKKFMKENHKDMNYNKVRNSLFSYLKYSDNSDNQTILFFLTPDSVCKSIQLICNSTLKNDKIKELDANYRKLGDYSWLDDRNGNKYLITLKDEKWSCSITIKPDK